ncbi:MAG: hypothetical protein J5742_02820 [Alphaproteobacteria bacterium]|nr:hypothetical protein [Alphaproteobacteria bacterium]
MQNNNVICGVRHKSQMKFLSKTDGAATLNFHHRQRQFFGTGNGPIPDKTGWKV